MAQNKIITVQLYGGIMGMFIGSPKMALERSIAKANRNGYEVIQIIDSSSGNIALNVIRIILLFFTFFLFTLGNGYYIICRKVGVGSGSSNMDNASSEKEKPRDELGFLKHDNCTSCGTMIQIGSKFCENCGKKVLKY